MEPNPSRIDVVRAMDELFCSIEERREHLYRRYQSNSKILRVIDFPVYFIRDSTIEKMYLELDCLCSLLLKIEREEYTPGLCPPLPSDYKLID